VDISSSDTLAQNVKKYRLRQGWSQDKMARAANIPYSTYLKIESGVTRNPSLQTAVNIADALGMSLDNLIGRTIPDNS
jgi:transcriptional regulator with XRE-family HTH domain